MNKERFLKIINNNTEDVMPLLHFYHNLCVKPSQKELTLEEFTVAYSYWLQIPLVQVSHSRIIETVINKLKIHFEL